MTTTAAITNWDVDRLCDLTGKRYLDTGGNSGVGFEAAVPLRRGNADVLIASRSTTKGSAAAKTLNEISGAGQVQLIQVDLASLESIRAANDSIREHTDGLDGLINNAGIMQTRQQQTADGFELQFGTNHLGHFMLNHPIFDLVAARSGRLDAASFNVIAASAHPGYSATNLQSTGPAGLFKLIYKVSNKVMAQKPSLGALPEVLTVAGTEAMNGAYYGPTSFGETRGPVGNAAISEAAQAKAAGARLWTLSEELLDITWNMVTSSPTDSTSPESTMPSTRRRGSSAAIGLVLVLGWRYGT